MVYNFGTNQSVVMLLLRIEHLTYSVPGNISLRGKLTHMMGKLQ